MAERYTDFVLEAGVSWFAGTLLRGSWAALLQWPAARRVDSTDYPEMDGKEVDFGAGLYDGAPRELRLPLYFHNMNASDLWDALWSPNPELIVGALAYRTGVQVIGVEAVTQGRHGAWATVRMLERKLPDWLTMSRGFVDAELMPGTLALRGEIDLDQIGVGVVPGVWAPKGGAQRKRLSNPGYALADGIGMEEAKVVLPCVMGGFNSIEYLLIDYGVAWMRLLWNLKNVDFYTECANYFGARYESQRVVAFDPARRWVQFEVTLAVRRVEVL